MSPIIRGGFTQELSSTIKEVSDPELERPAVALALTSIAQHLDRIYDRLAHIEHQLEELSC